MAQFIQRRRNIPVEMVCKSEPMYYYLGSKGGLLIGATQRIATMYLATEDNKEHRQVVESIFENLIGKLEQETVEYKRQTDVIRRQFRRKIKNLSENSIEIPENHTYTIGITHPIFNRIVSVISALDNNMASLEALWLMGILDEARYKNSKMKMSSILTIFTHEVFKITNQLRSTSEIRGNTRRQINHQIASAVEQNDAANSNADNVATEQSVATQDVEQSVSVLDTQLTSEDDNPLTDDDIGQMLDTEALKESA